MKFRLGLNQAQGASSGTDALTQGFGNAFQAMAMLPMLRAQAAEEAQDAETKRMLTGAQMRQADASSRQADAHAALYGQQTRAAQDELTRRSLPELIKSAALQNGVAPHQLEEFGQYATTGKLPGQYVAPSDGIGPVAPAPAYSDPEAAKRIWQTLGLTSNALAQGDKSVENVAAAAGKYQDQGIERQALDAAARGDDMAMSRLNTVRGKREFTPFAAVGTTGTALNQVTGAQPVANPAMNILFNQGEQAQIGQRNASAFASRTAGQENQAQIRKINQEITHARGGDWQYDSERGGQVNKLTGEFRPVTQGGAPIGAKKGAEKAMTEGQSKANLFGGRMLESDAILNELEKAGVYRPGNIKSTAETIGRIAGLGTDSMGGTLADAAGTLTNWTQSGGQQRVEQARRDFINAVLRRESGAAISPQEFVNAEKQYFPQPNDTKEQREQKRRARQIATTLMLQEVPESQRYRLGSIPPVNNRPGAEGSWDTPQRTVQVNY